MFKPLSKILFMITVLVAFIGQTFAYHFMVPYDDISNQQSTALQQSFDNHNYSNNHNDDSNMSASTDDCCEVECCENECICPANACTSVVYIETNLPLSELAGLSEPMLSLAQQKTHFIASSLDRPPISAS